MSKHIEVNLGKCTACRLCEFACAMHHFGEINPTRSRIKVNMISKDFFYYPNVCKQCSKAPCMEVCPKGALVRADNMDAIIVNKDDCIGCRLCVSACPFGAMGFYKEDKLADKCDLCGGDPECVKHCFYGALEFKSSEQTISDISDEYTRKVKTAYMQEVTQ